MKRSVLVLALSTTCATVAAGAEPADRIQASRAAVKAFMGELKSELQAAMKAEGPVHAIEVCNKKAPRIAARISKDKGWEVGRTSLNLRNPGNAPDDWEREVLQTFEQRKAEGEDPRKIEYSELVEVDGEKAFRYMKAIPTGGVCLACHGKNISEPVKSKLDELYPEDQARGYELGDIRGAFTITQPM